MDSLSLRIDGLVCNIVGIYQLIDIFSHFNCLVLLLQASTHSKGNLISLQGWDGT